MAAEIVNKFLRLIGVVEYDDDGDRQDGSPPQPQNPYVVSRGQPAPNNTRQPYDDSRSRQTGYEQPQQRQRYQEQRYNEPRPTEQRYNEQRYQEQRYQEQNPASAKGGKVVQHPSNEYNARHQTSIYQINEHSETRPVIDDLLKDKSVLLNLENLDAVESQRVIDTLSGAAYAISAKLRKVAHQTYLIAPQNVEIGGNYPDEAARNAAAQAGYVFRSRQE